MALQTTPYTLPILVGGVAYAAFAVYLLRRPRRRQSTASYIAAPLLLGVAVWLLAYAGSLSVTTVPAKLLFARLQYVGPATVPLLWFAFVLTYTGHANVLDRRWWAALAVPPVVLFVLAATYPASRLVWRSVELVDTGSWVALVADHGIGFYAYHAYVYALFAATIWLLAGKFARSTGVYRRQTAGLLVGALVPGVVGLIYITELSPVPTLDLPAISLVVTAGAVAWSVLRDDLFTLAPVAWETAVAQLDDPVFVVNTESRVVAANEAGRAFADVEGGESADDTLGAVFDEPYWREPGDHQFDALRGGERGVYEVSVTPVERGNARLGSVVVVREVTERHRREQRLEEFASVVSHDLRNPLNVARGHLELGRETGDDDHFAETDEALDRMEHIIDDLLTLAREGTADPDAETVSLATAAHTAWDAVDTMDADATIDVQGDRSVVAEETALLRLLENLFRNAVEHGSTSPRSQHAEDAVENASTSHDSDTHEDTVGTSSDEPSVANALEDAVEHSSTNPRSQAHEDALEHGGEDVTVTVGTTDDGFFVADDGPGIPESERDAVFERGYTTSEDGTGFGLAIVKEVADVHGWDVSLTTAQSEGARFDITVE